METDIAAASRTHTVRVLLLGRTNLVCEIAICALELASSAHKL